MLDDGRQNLLGVCKDGKQMLSSGYRKKTGNVCDGGLALDIGVIYDCGGGSGRGFFGWVGWFFYWAFVIAFWIGVIVGVVALFYRYKEYIPGFSDTGRIRLPVDGLGEGIGRYAGNFRERAGSFFRNAAVYSVEIAEVVMSEGKRLVSWAGDMISGGGGRGYASVPSEFEFPRQPDLGGTSLFDVDDDAA